LIIIAAAAERFVSYKFPYVLSNFTPVGAIALFGGVYFKNKWKAYAVVLIALFASDVLINHLYSSKWVFWYGGAFWTYFAFALMVFVGSFVKKVNIASVGIASLIAIALHWLITDMPWIYDASLYPHNLTGYGQSLVAAIPFERNMVLGDIVFCGILFGGFEFAKNKYAVLRGHKELAV
jgi:hypothetical protein